MPEERTCAKCGQTDSDPHHVQYVAFNHPVTGEGTDLSVTKHVDCCAEDGCEICGADVARATQDGTPIPQFVIARPEDHQQLLLDKFGVETPDAQTTAPAEEA